jgi:flagellar motor switch protein FliN
MPMNRKADREIELWCAAWSRSLAQLVSQLTAASWTARDCEGCEPAGEVWISVRAASGRSGAQRLGLGLHDAAQMLTLLLGEAVEISGTLDDVQKEALTEFIRRWAELAQTALQPDFGEILLEVSDRDGVNFAGDWSARLLVEEGARSLAVVLQLSEDLARDLSQNPADTRAQPAAAVPEPAPPAAELLREGNLELLMDLELPVSLRFGSRTATLGDVLGLTAGSVLELDQDIRQPVDLVINGIVVARGEAVVVDGDYGLRITEVGSPRRRISSALDMKSE